jgi:hypothetical protein
LHITASGDVTTDDVEDVIRDHPRRHDDPDDCSESTGLPMVFGDTSSGKHIVVIYEDWSDDEYTIIRRRTSYPVKAYGD